MTYLVPEYESGGAFERLFHPALGQSGILLLLLLGLNRDTWVRLLPCMLGMQLELARRDMRELVSVVSRMSCVLVHRQVERDDMRPG